jgi:hypothetical protein
MVDHGDDIVNFSQRRHFEKKISFLKGCVGCINAKQSMQDLGRFQLLSAFFAFELESSLKKGTV